MNTLIHDTKTDIAKELIAFTKLKYIVTKVHLLLHLNSNTTLFSRSIWIQIQWQMNNLKNKM